MQNSVKLYLEVKIKRRGSRSSKLHNVIPRGRSQPIIEPLHHLVTKKCKSVSYSDSEKGSNSSSSSKKSSKSSRKSLLSKSSKKVETYWIMTRCIYHSEDVILTNLISYYKSIVKKEFRESCSSELFILIKHFFSKRDKIQKKLRFGHI